MALLQQDKAIYHHPLDTVTESLESDVWTASVQPVTNTANLSAAKISSGLFPTAIYDPDLGTVPDAQGFTLKEDNGPAAASVAGGVLTSTTTSNGQNQFWRTGGVFGDFGDWTTDEFEIEFDLKIINSTYSPGGTFWRIGWDVFLEDANNRGFTWGVSGTGVRMSNDLGSPGSGAENANSPAFVATATTDDFHKYRFAISGGTGSLYKDGSLLVSQAIGIANGFLANQITYGDSTSSAFSNTRLRKVTFPLAKLSGAGASYPSAIGSTKLAYMGWLKNPSVQ